MIYQVQPIDPIAFELGPLSVYWYGVIIGLGALIGYIIATREAKKRGLPNDLFADLLIWAIPISIISARLYYVLFNLEYYVHDPLQMFAIWEGGLAIHGGLIGAVITGAVFARLRGISFWKLADIAAPSIILGQAIGRWGNFINQEAHGGEVSRIFLENIMLPEWIIDQMFIEGAYYHPTFLYESIWNFLGFALLLYLRRVNLRRGELFLTYVIWYSFGRFFIEGLRTDSLMIADFLRTAQVISIILIVGSIIVMIYRRRKGLAKKRYYDTDKEQKKNKKKKK
ncbi:phosphatidylglycerol:prolipoprotein diacylglycerol transferase [Geomicrobium halophilum]|uniref:Phosphatidylglycerol--prolipoprotein diacylglyceryl transferase n=1 Tax=Geomicrobium halophilum TaxID=549000 RepID=A0A841PT32_9BACL|nr:prolipoprotein diacylglyceryl transferase [Geomicrobium halophilum]MBB6450346.1 phosphatidylglycerol:prolipoprotein diacylglycerol transferase [Geomicrobium halophilum]